MYTIGAINTLHGWVSRWVAPDVQLQMTLNVQQQLHTLFSLCLQGAGSIQLGWEAIYLVICALLGIVLQQEYQ